MYEIRKERGDFDRYLKGYGIDIGSGDDPLSVALKHYDRHDGDATYMEGFSDSTFDFVYSSHCLEHLENVELALKHWARILKPGGYLYMVVPDFILYEKCCFPSIFNGDHKATFSLFFDRIQIRRDTHYGYYQMQNVFAEIGVELQWPNGCQVECNGYDFTLGPEIDQTMGNAVAQICFIAKKP